MKLTDRTKDILAGVLCFMLVIVGTAAFSCFFVGVVCTLDSVFSGADMTTWETDPYIMDVDIGIIAVYLCGLYYLLSLPLIRMKRKSIAPEITAAAVIAVLSLMLCMWVGMPCVFIIPFSLLALLTVRRKYKNVLYRDSRCMYFSGGIHRGLISGDIYPDACFAGTVQFYYAQLSNPELFSIHGICRTAYDHLRCVLCPVFSRKAKGKEH